MMDLFTFLPPKKCERPYTVTEINEGIAVIIESGNTLVWVEAEVSNFKHASSGHYYMKLIDENSRIPAVMWRSVAEKHTFEPEDGMSVTVIASIRVFRKGGYYQLEIHRMQPSGPGAMYAAFEKLKKRLEAEGLFDPEYKKQIPESVQTLGVITAKSGAAIRDIIKVVRSRAPQTDILLRDVPVQGEQAPAEISKAIMEMNEYRNIDCIIVGRGGGSVEDLAAFNDERIIRSIFESAIPIISAVGHEIDFTLADFVADLRAPTPSAAAEIAVPDERESRRYFEELTKRFSSTVQYYFASVNKEYKNIIYNPIFRKPLHLFIDARQQCDTLHERSVRSIAYTLKKYQTQLSRNAAQLQALGPLAVLSRGYSVVSKNDGKPIKQSKQLQAGDNVDIKFFKGDASANIRSIN